MKIVAINGSPRKKGNTAIVLQHVLDGAKAVNAQIETQIAAFVLLPVYRL